MYVSEQDEGPSHVSPVGINAVGRQQPGNPGVNSTFTPIPFPPPASRKLLRPSDTVKFPS